MVTISGNLHMILYSRNICLAFFKIFIEFKNNYFQEKKVNLVFILKKINYKMKKKHYLSISHRSNLKKTF